jgi:putative histidinol phosphatase
MSRGWTQTPYPSSFILKRILTKNIPITISSDAHETKNIDFYFDESLGIIRKIGFKSVKILKDEKFQDFNI